MQNGDDKSDDPQLNNLIDKPFDALPLFRVEAATHRPPWIGSIHLQPDSPSSKYLSFALASIAISLGFFLLLPIERKAKAPGFLTPLGGATTVTAQQHSIVEKILVDEGQVVDFGQPLAKLFIDRKATQDGELIDVGERQTKSLSVQLKSLSSEEILRAHQYDVDLASNSQKELGLKNDLNQLLIEADLVGSRKASAEKEVARHRKLVDSGFLSPSAAEAKIDALNDIQSREVEIRRSIESTKRQLEENESAKRALAIRVAIEAENVKRSKAEVENQLAEMAARSSTMLISPMKGIVSTITVREGSEVSTGQAVLTVLSAKNVAQTQQPDLEANLFLPSRLVGFCRAGQRVKLRYAAYPYQKFGVHTGWITEISGSPINSQDLPPGLAQSLLSANTTTEPLYRVRVRLAEQYIQLQDGNRSLKAGLVVDGDIIQDSRSIVEWAAEPLIAAWRRAK